MPGFDRPSRPDPELPNPLQEIDDGFLQRIRDLPFLQPPRAADLPFIVRREVPEVPDPDEVDARSESFIVFARTAVAALILGDADRIDLAESHEAISEGVADMATVITSRDVIKKATQVIVKVTAGAFGVPPGVDSAAGYLAGKVVESSTKDLTAAPDEIRDRVADTLMVLDSARCATKGELDTCPSAHILVDKYGDQGLEHRLDEITDLLRPPNKEFPPQVVSTTDSPSSFIGLAEEPAVKKDSLAPHAQQQPHVLDESRPERMGVPPREFPPQVMSTTNSPTTFIEPSEKPAASEESLAPHAQQQPHVLDESQPESMGMTPIVASSQLKPTPTPPQAQSPLAQAERPHIWSPFAPPAKRATTHQGPPTVRVPAALLRDLFAALDDDDTEALHLALRRLRRLHGKDDPRH